MKRLIFCAILLVLLFPCRAHAFIFTDLVAKVQRIKMIAQAGKQLDQIDSYRKEFDKYKTEFDKYYQNFRRIYRRLSSADWGDFTPSNWGQARGPPHHHLEDFRRAGVANAGSR